LEEIVIQDSTPKNMVNIPSFGWEGVLQELFLLGVSRRLLRSCNRLYPRCNVGSQVLPEKWVSLLNDRIGSFVLGFNNYQICDLAKRTLKIAKEVLRESSANDRFSVVALSSN
jgi:hypothetical protein